MDSVMNKYISSLLVMLIITLTLASLTSISSKQTTKISYVEQIQQIAKKMEVFPVDLIARDGPISYFEKGSKYPIIGFREELDRGDFKRFYDFCQLAFNARQKDIDACVSYLPQASAKEKALILTVFYIYAYPWEKQKLIVKKEDKRNAIRFKSWASIQYPAGAFGPAAVKKNRRNPREIERLAQIIAQYAQSDEIAFPPVVSERGKAENDRNKIRTRLFTLVENLDIQDNSPYYFQKLYARKEVVDAIRRHSDSASEIISDLLYFTYSGDMFEDFSSLSPSKGNASENPKNVGHIAQELLESWDPPLWQSERDSKPEGFLGLRTISVPFEGLDDDEKVLLDAVKGVVDVLSKGRTIEQILNDCDQYSDALFGDGPSVGYDKPVQFFALKVEDKTPIESKGRKNPTEIFLLNGSGFIQISHEGSDYVNAIYVHNYSTKEYLLLWFYNNGTLQSLGWLGFEYDPERIQTSAFHSPLFFLTPDHDFRAVSRFGHWKDWNINGKLRSEIVYPTPVDP